MSGLIPSKDVAESISSWLRILTVVIAGVYGVLEYVEHKLGVRTERALQYVENYRKGAVAESRMVLADLLYKNQAEMIAVLGRKYESDLLLNQAYNQFVIGLVNAPEVKRHFEITFSFYEEAAICANHNLCDKDAIRSFFSNDVIGLFNSYSPYICSLRHQWKNDQVYLEVERLFVGIEHEYCKEYAGTGS